MFNPFSNSGGGGGGSVGPQGPQGPAGDSAYEIWLNEGHTGTEEDFLNSLKGETGPAGPQGPQGVKGETGSTGPQGETGPAGPQGPQGIKGETGSQGPQGEAGAAGAKGETGNGIDNIEKTGTSGKVDTYTINFTDGTTSTFSVTNGTDGQDGQPGKDGVDGQPGQDGADGQPGQDGVSVTDVEVDSNNHLIVTLSNSTEVDAGEVQGRLTTLTYGVSTWNDFITAYRNSTLVYCKAYSSGSQTRLAFMAYVNNDNTPTQVEFQYYRSVSNKNLSNQCDQVIIYQLDNTGAWTTTTRSTDLKFTTGTALSTNYASNTITFNHADSGVTPGTYTSVEVDAQGHVVAGSTSDPDGVKNLAIPSSYNIYNGGITFTRDDEYKVTADGTAGATIRYIVTQIELPAGSYIVSGCTGGSGSTYRLRIGTGTENTYLDAVTTEEKTITLNSDTLLTVEVNVFNGTTVNNQVFPVMVRKANITDDTYALPSYSTSTMTRKMLLTQPDAPLKILCIGDSISYGARNGLRGFVGGLGFPYQIEGLTGATLSTAQAGVKNIPQQLIDSTYSNPDVIISDGGVNDYLQNAPLGTIPTTLVTDDTADEALNLSTICGGVQHLFYNMIKKYPDAQRFFLLTHKTTASAPAYTYGSNLALVTTQTRQASGVDFVNNSDNTFSVFRTPTTSAPITAGFTLADVSLEAGTYIFEGLDDGRWTTGSDEYLLLRYKDKSTSATVCDITNKPLIVTFNSAVTLQASFYVGELYNGTYKTVAPIIRKCTPVTTVHDWTTVPNRALLTQTEIYEAIRQIAKLYGVKIIDVFNDSMINTAFSQYVSPTHWDTDHSVTDREYCDDDGIHPLNKGYENAYLPLIRKALQIGTEK